MVPQGAPWASMGGAAGYTAHVVGLGSTFKAQGPWACPRSARSSLSLLDPATLRVLPGASGVSQGQAEVILPRRWTLSLWGVGIAGRRLT